ncbi:UNVERIFIED_CONTAM: Receptor kinase-like protein Xa21 [Sesamum calycinum]|uniref:non-specific serine/threonine protein kinase n=1 Tax=Sesamum calycinum TaxID=2727403 RepID=A0AAW2R9T8_9LAMI
MCSHLPNLQELNLYNNDLYGPIPSMLDGCSRLQDLSLRDNNFTGFIPREIGNLTMLKSLRLFHNRLTGEIPAELGKLRQLEQLHLAVNLLTGSIPEEIANISTLTLLALTANRLSGSLPKRLSFITSLANCRLLTDFWMHNNRADDFLPPSIGNLSTSLKLLVSLCFLPSGLGSLALLQGLFLSDNRISGSIPAGVCELTNLGELHLSNNQISSQIPGCIGNGISLRQLYLDSNRLRNLEAAVLIDLSFNQFTQNIPITIGGLNNLVNFSLSHNRLLGSIPNTTGNMISLEVLDLAHNNLSGSIPMSLETLKNLKTFNVSYNSLSGEIPPGGPFVNFTRQSFMFNEALCGPRRFEVPPCPTPSSHRSNSKILLLALTIPLGVLGILTALILALIVIKYRKKRKVPARGASFQGTALGRISYYELLRATDGYNDNNLLGRGSFGAVYKGVLDDGTILAVKVFNLEKEAALKSFDAECEVLRNIRHRNLTRVISSCSNQEFKALVLEYMPNGSLEKWLHSDDYFLDTTLRLNIMIDVASALEFLHHGLTTAVVHCDLKPSNVLLDEDMVAHLSDFGIAKLLGEDQSISYTNTLATFGYIAPEYGSEGIVSIKCDIYSYGILLMETFSRRKPSDEMFDEEMNIKRWISNAVGDDGIVGIVDAKLLSTEDRFYNEKLSCLSSLMELALNCCEDNPEDRLGMSDVLAALKKIKLQFLAYGAPTTTSVVR